MCPINKFRGIAPTLLLPNNYDYIYYLPFYNAPKISACSEGTRNKRIFLSLCSLINEYMYKLFVILCFRTNLKTRFSKITYKNNSPRFFLPFFLICFIKLEWGKKKQRPPRQTAERVGRGGR